MQDPLDVDIEDPELGDEIQLLSDLMVLIAGSDDPDPADIDAVLLSPEVPRQRDTGTSGPSR